MKESIGIKILRIFAIYITPVLLALFFIAMIIGGTISAIKYTELIDDAITVDAVVTKHEEITDDNHVDYVSCVSYTVDGVKYEDIEYKTEDIQDQLDPIGTTVRIKVNPENPKESMSDIRFSAILGLVPFPPMLVFGLFTIIRIFIEEHYVDYTVDVVNEQSIEQSFRNLMKTRTMRPTCFVLTVYYVVIELIFPIVLNTMPFAFVTAAVYVYLLGKDLFRLICIKTSRYTLCKGRFEEKFETLNDDKETVYRIKYYFPDLKESKYNSVSYGEYQSVNERDRSYLVFFPNEINIDKPFLNFYETNGKIQIAER